MRENDGVKMRRLWTVGPGVTGLEVNTYVGGEDLMMGENRIVLVLLGVRSFLLLWMKCASF